MWLYTVAILWYRNGVDDITEENSSVFSQIWIHSLHQQVRRVIKLCSNEILWFLTGCASWHRFTFVLSTKHMLNCDNITVLTEVMLVIDRQTLTVPFALLSSHGNCIPVCRCKNRQKLASCCMWFSSVIVEQPEKPCFTIKPVCFWFLLRYILN